MYTSSINHNDETDTPIMSTGSSRTHASTKQENVKCGRMQLILTPGVPKNPEIMKSRKSMKTHSKIKNHVALKFE